VWNIIHKGRQNLNAKVPAKHRNTLCWQKVETLNFKPGGTEVTTGLLRVIFAVN